jgi:F-type H+-transporting ATPase subunit delta
MSVLRISTRYAKSLLQLAEEQGKLERVYQDVLKLHEATRNRDLYLLLKSPIVAGDKKVAVFERLFGQSMDVLTLSYLKLLVQKGRESYIPEITDEFVKQYKEMKKIMPVRVVTPVPLSESVMDQLQQRLLQSGVVTQGTLEIETEVDPDLIGGFVLEFDNKRYDASIAHKLDELRAQFNKNLYVKEF